MASSRYSRRLHPHVIAVLKEMREEDPEAAIRSKANGVLKEFLAIFGGEPPFNLDAIASFRDLHHSGETPQHSEDSEIAPQKDGRVFLRVNRDRPVTRQRFSVGHEIGHTLFPEYKLAVRCRKGHDRDWADSTDLVETLCDVAASEFLFPAPWFPRTAENIDFSASELGQLASTYEASREATIRRFVEVRPEPLAAVFFSWKLKPTEIRRLESDRRQIQMFGAPSPIVPKLRVDYAVINTRFAEDCVDHIPKDKSVDSKGPIYEASTTGQPADGVSSLDLGCVNRTFSICALPIYTPEESLGPGGAIAVVAVLQPVKARHRR